MMQQLLVQVSNTSEHVGEDEWQWKVTVDAGDDTETFSVASVTLQLHPTFTPRRAILARTTFDERNQFESIVYTGWGTFLISIDMELVVTTPQGRVESKTVRVTHMLVFQDGQVHTTRHVLDRNGVVVQQNTGRTESEQTIPASSSSTTNSVRQQSFPIVSKRSVYLTRLAKTADTPSPCFRPFWHGRLTKDLSNNLKQPTVRWLSRHKPRDDHVDDGQPGWLTATEYQDVDAVLDAKLELLADLIRASKNTVVYSGAGISVAAGIGQAARGGNAAAASANVDVTAQPTATHRALTALHQHGLLHGWVQQNHDGLPQKAGFPQECINEIHGSWYDPSNPVVLYSGSLKTHEYLWMKHLQESADLVLVLGTSMSGLSADATATQCAERSKRGIALGMVICNLQQTLQDGKATLRLFEETDAVFSALLAKLKIALPPPLEPPRGYQPQQQQQRVLVPYDRHGQRVDAKVGSPRRLMWWDLRPDARVQLHATHNIEGSGQPGYQHLAKKRQPQGVVTDWNERTTGIHMSIQGVSMTLGQWWLEAAQRGGPPSLPVVNVHPEFVQG